MRTVAVRGRFSVTFTRSSSATTGAESCVRRDPLSDRSCRASLLVVTLRAAS